MPLEAAPLCPHCGGPLLASQRGDRYCVQHGMWFSATVLSEGLGAAATQSSMDLAAQGATCGRRCPHDRLAMSTVRGARVTVEACGRCGSVWLPKTELDKVVATTPAIAGVSPAENRSLLGFAAVRSLLAPPARPGAPPARPSPVRR